MAGSYCQECGERVGQGGSYCPSCGTSLQQPAAAPQGAETKNPNPQPQATARGQVRQYPEEENSATGLLIGGFVSALIALFFLPIVFGPVGIYCGYKAREKGRDGAGLALMILSVATLVLGMVIGAIIGFSAFA